MAEATTHIYPHFVVKNNEKPNRFFAFPFLGVIIKIALLLPILIEVMVLGIAALVVLLINWFIVLFTGKYWDVAYTFFVGLMRLTTKMKLFIWGITDKYPGFSLKTNGLFELEIAKPQQPNRLLAIPFLALIIRGILLFPFLIFAEVMERGSQVAMFVSWFAVLFKGKFPESLYEFEKDSLRVSLASSCYMLGLSDKYPSFAISMNHQTIKLLLIIAGAFLTVWRMQANYEPKQMNERTMHRYQYDSRYDYSPDRMRDYNNNNTY